MCLILMCLIFLVLQWMITTFIIGVELLDMTGCPGSVITVLMLSPSKVQYCDNWRMAANLTRRMKTSWEKRTKKSQIEENLVGLTHWLLNKQVWIVQNWSTGGVKDPLSLKYFSSILTRLFFFINWRGFIGLLIWNKAYKELLTKQMCELPWIQVSSNQEIVKLLTGYKQIK